MNSASRMKTIPRKSPSYMHSQHVPLKQEARESSSLPYSSRNSDNYRVNGKGMWRAWTRSFDTPMLALLDLFDNAVDASWTLLERNNRDGILQIASPKKPRIHVDLDKRGGNRGIVIRNSCAHTLPPLSDVLEVYKSDKGAADIGENGIGIKHACASLSGLSFVFTKTKDHFSMGVLMEALQEEKGIVLPSIQFELEEDLETAIRALAEEQPDIWGLALEEYGAYDGADNPLENGILSCVDHFRDMVTVTPWKDCENVFAVVLTSLRHASYEKGQGVVDLTADGTEEQDESVKRGESILKELKQDLPRLYLHLHHLEIRIQNDLVEGAYWEKRLVELSQFNVEIDPSKSWREYGPGWYRDPITFHQNKRTVRFFAGFDPHRCVETMESGEDMNSKPRAKGDISSKMKKAPPAPKKPVSSALMVYMYSRESGRLIKVQNDPRSHFGLAAGSSDFKQGLTVILDDYNGTLPLNPTKQDTAFGHTEHGRTHAENLQEWTSAITHFFWTYSFEQSFNSKLALTSAVGASKATLGEVFGGGNPSFSPTPLSRGPFITYDNLSFAIQHHGAMSSLRTRGPARKSVEVRIGNPSDYKRIVRLNLAAAATTYANATSKTTPKRKKDNNSCDTSPSAKRTKMDNGAKLHKMLEEKTEEFELLTQERDDYIQRAEKLSKENKALKREVKKMSAELAEAQEANKQLHCEMKKLSSSRTIVSPSRSINADGAGNDDNKKLKERGDKYKKLSVFYKDQSTAYKKKVDELSIEKCTLEERIASLLTVDCLSGDEV